MANVQANSFVLTVIVVILLIIVGVCVAILNKNKVGNSYQGEGLTISHGSKKEQSERGGIFMSGGTGVYGGGFALLVVLFILLVIIGAAWL